MTPDVEYDSARDSLLRELDRMRGSVNAPHLMNRLERFIDAKIALERARLTSATGSGAA